MYDLHHLGWNSFQQLCQTITRELLGQTIQSFLDSKDAGRDGAFTGTWSPRPGETLTGRFVIQCKFSGKPGKLLTKGDIKSELPKVKKLVSAGACDIYVLMTNTGVSGPREIETSDALKAVGAKHVLIYGSTWIEAVIRENSRLRTLVPRIYGLGDLSQILDKRAYEQARAVLESLREDLAKVVITDSYRQAVSALDTHGFVLLIGEPAAGKTTIASMLAMAAADRWKSAVLKLDDPHKVIEHWNVDEPSQFFWLDDAFGVTQYESPLVYKWNHILPQIKTMIRKGAKIVMTSRDYIYNSARDDLKEGAFPLLNESQVVIDVHDLALAEKQQILYNHLKLGRQKKTFLSEIKPHLDSVASHPRFIPETARRIADPLFTKGLYLSEFRLGEFVQKREKLLFEIIQGLDGSSKAALGLIYMRKDHLESPIVLQAPEVVALDRLDSTLGKCSKALDALKGSLVSFLHIEDQSVWRFKHPTIGDAYAASLAQSPDLLEIFLTGSSTENLISQVTCGDVGVEKAVVVAKSLFPLIVKRLLEFTKSEQFKTASWAEWQAKRSLDQFLANRCSREFLAMYLQQDAGLLSRISAPKMQLSFSTEVRVVVRLWELDLLPQDARKAFVETVSGYAVDGDDVYALESAGIREVFTNDEFQHLVQTVRNKLLPRLDDVRLSIQQSHGSTDPPEEHMQTLLDTFATLKTTFSDDPEAIEIVERELLRAHVWIIEAEPPEAKKAARTLGGAEPASSKHGTRSIFDDIDDVHA